MFEPRNDLEHVLVESVQDPTRRGAFLRRLLDGEVFVAMSCNQPLVADADGKATFPAGALLSERVVIRDGERLFPFFTCPGRARVIFKDDHVIMPDTPRKIFERHPNARCVLNPGSDHHHEFSPEETAKLLAGDFSPTVNTVEIKQQTEVLVGQPAPYPTEMVDKLKQILPEHKAIAAAYLAQVAYGDTKPHPMIALTVDGEWREMMDRLRLDLPRAIPGDKMVDFGPYPDGPLSDYFATIQPFYRRPESASGWRRWFGGR